MDGTNANPIEYNSLVPADIAVQQVSLEHAGHCLDISSTGSWRQYPAYAKGAANAAGAESLYLLVSQNDKALAIANLRVKKLPAISAGVAMIAQGPVMLDHQTDMLDIAYQALRTHVTDHMGLTLRINPPVFLDKALKGAAEYIGFRALAGSQYQTFIMDLRPGVDSLRAGLNGKWRTDLRRGEKLQSAGEIAITRSRKPQDIRSFQPLLAGLATKKGFSTPQDADFFADIAAQCNGSEHYAVHLAWHDGQMIGGHIGAYSGDMAVYLLGATNDIGRDMRASFLLQWSVIDYAIENGLNYYDLGGVDELENPSVFRFKKRMGGQYYKGPPVIEARAPWPKGQIVDMAERVYKRVKG